MLLIYLILALTVCQVVGVALLLYRQEQHRHRTEELASAVLATLTADDPREIDPALGRVLDARDLTDEQLVAEVTRRKSAQASVPQQVIRATAGQGQSTLDGQPVAGQKVQGPAGQP